MKRLTDAGIELSLVDGKLRLNPKPGITLTPEIVAYAKANKVRFTLELMAMESVAEHGVVDSHGITHTRVQKPESEEEGYFSIIDELIAEGRYKNPSRRGNSSLGSASEAKGEWNWSGYEGFL